MHYRPAGDVCVMVTPCRSYMQIMFTTAMLVSEAIAGGTPLVRKVPERLYVGARRWILPGRRRR